MRRLAFTLALAVLLPARLAAQGPGVAPPPVAPPVVSQASDPDKALGRSVPGYYRRVIEGFTVLLDPAVLAHNDDPAFKRAPLDVLELELGTIARVLPRRDVLKLQSLLVFVEWDDKSDPDYSKGALAKYYGVSGDVAVWAWHRDKNPAKANNIELLSLKHLAEEHQPGTDSGRSVLLHEMAHAVHHKTWGFTNPEIHWAYQQAMDRHLYGATKDAAGREVRAYAGVNEREYFAELTCAYLSRLAYYPFDRADLKKHDPAGYRLMERVWGSAKTLDAILKVDTERVAAAKLTEARRLERDGKPDRARRVLARLVAGYPDTKAAAEAKQLLDTGGR
jgi:hypothetical protein